MEIGRRSGENTKMRWCIQHEQVIDTWYDCKGCLRESNKWCKHIGETDKELWVSAHEGRWVELNEEFRRAEHALESKKSEMQTAKRYVLKMRREFDPPTKPIVVIRERTHDPWDGTRF